METGPSSEMLSLFGAMEAVLIPRCLGFSNPYEVGKALLAWKYGMSRDEVALLSDIATGLTNDQIAAKRHLVDVKSVKHRVQTVYDKLGVNRRTEATLIAAHFGLGIDKVTG